MRNRRPGSWEVQRHRASTCSAPVGAVSMCHMVKQAKSRGSYSLIKPLMLSRGPLSWPQLILMASQMPQLQMLWTYESGYWVSKGWRFRGYIPTTLDFKTTQWFSTMETLEVLFPPSGRGQLLTTLRTLVTPKDSSSSTPCHLMPLSLLSALSFVW